MNRLLFAGAGLLLLAGYASAASPPRPTPIPAPAPQISGKFTPPPGKMLFFIGQDVGAVRATWPTSGPFPAA